MSLTTQAIEFVVLFLIGSLAVPALLVLAGAGLYLSDRNTLGAVLGGTGALGGVAIWQIGTGRIRWLAQNYFQSWHKTTRSFDLMFQSGVATFTSPVGGWLDELAASFLTIESGFNGVADYLPNIATDLKNVNIENPDLFGFEVKELSNAIAALEGMYDLFGTIVSLFGGIVHFFVTIPAAIFGYAGTFFATLASVTPIEAASAFLGGVLLFTILATSSFVLLASLIEFVLRAIGAGLRWLGSLVGLSETKRPTSKLFKGAVNSVTGRIVLLATGVAISVPLLVYPVVNVLGPLMLAVVGSGFVIYGDFADRDRMWMFGVAATFIGVPGLFFEVGLGLTDVLVFAAAGIILLVWGTNYVEKVAPQFASEEPA